MRMCINFVNSQRELAGMASSSPSHDHIGSNVPVKPFNNRYGGSSDNQLSLLSAAKVAATFHSTTSLESSTSSSRSNAPKYEFLKQGKHSVPRKVRSGENLDVAVTGDATGAGLTAAGDAAQCDGSELSSVYPNSLSTSDDQQIEVGGSTPTTESDVSLSREEDDQTPRNPEHVEDHAADHEEADIGREDEHRDVCQKIRKN